MLSRDVGYIKKTPIQLLGGKIQYFKCKLHQLDGRNSI